MLREDDAIWMLRLILPYLNEFLSRLKALFSGDPGTTIKVIFFSHWLYNFGSLRRQAQNLIFGNLVQIAAGSSALCFG